MLANELARRSVRAIIIDRHSGPAQQTRAIGVQARTLEIYAKAGVIDEALALGRIATGANMWANGNWMARLPLGDIGKQLSPYPFVLALGQDDNERILGDKLHGYGIDVEWNTELVGFEQHPQYVDAVLKSADGSRRTIRAAWVAGCDGARSAVRNLSGITFPGAPYEHVFFVADTEATGSMRPDELNIYLWRDGFHLFFPMHGKDRWRVIGILPKALHDRDRLAFEDLVPDIQREAGTELSFKSCAWFSTYRIHHRAAERFRESRCFLLGDAAHIHSPAGGQGMNTGLQDAYNLGWKLALVVNGQANETLLDSYESERLPVARRLLQTTDRLFKVLVSDSWLAGLFRTRILARVAARAMTIERVRSLAFRSISQIGIRYRQSALSRMLDTVPKGGPVAGDRFPWMELKLDADGPVVDLFTRLDDRRFNVLLIGRPADVPLPENELLRVHEVPDDPRNREALASVGIGPQAFYLLRPDGHIGLAGTRLSAGAIHAYFAEHGFRARQRIESGGETTDRLPAAQLGRFFTNSTNSAAGNGLLTQ